ncbi:MAG: hypothetical protein ACRDKE_00815, partial [Solirubrobacterales bacterium]
MIDLNSHLPDPAANTSRTDLDAAMRSLASSITEISREAESSERSPRPRARRTMTLALATAACALLGLVGVSHLFGGGTGPTWAAADIAVAEKTPLL